MRALSWALLWGVVGLAAASPPASRPALQDAQPTVLAPLPFDHARHTRSLEKTGLACVDCHPVGLTAAPGQPLPADPAPPTESCHGCHLQELPGAPRRAPRTCATCHPVAQELLPVDHNAAWLTAHAPAARAPGATCETCHTRRVCVDCHDDRGPLSRTPHPPAFRATHGVEARLDPASCTTCHTGPSCTACHSTGSLPW